MTCPSCLTHANDKILSECCDKETLELKAQEEMSYGFLDPSVNIDQASPLRSKAGGGQ